VKSLHLVNAWHPTSGGISTFYRALIAAANETGYQLRLAVPGETERIDEAGPHCRIYSIRAPRAPFNPAYRILYPHNYLLPNGPLRRIVAAERPDLIEVCDKYTLPYFGGMIRVGWLGPNPPVVIAMSCERLDDNMGVYLSTGPIARAFARWYMRAIYFPLSDHHITVSAYTAGELEAASHGHKVTRGVWVRPMGVDTATFHPRRRDLQLRTRLLDGAESLVLYAGRLAPEKNLQLLSAAIRRLPSRFRAVIAGSGPLRQTIERECRDRAVFLDHVRDRAELATLFASCDVFAHPNPAEPFGIAPLEAMASGLGLVVPNSGGVLEYATTANSWLAAPEPEAFAQAIVDAASGGRRLEARETAEQFAWPIVARSFFGLYRVLAASRREPSRLAECPPRFFSTFYETDTQP
jgi:glycosyltransferase involved in cell wall biosynthesis